MVARTRVAPPATSHKPAHTAAARRPMNAPAATVPVRAAAPVTPLRPAPAPAVAVPSPIMPPADGSPDAPHEPADVLLPDTDTSDEVGSNDPGNARFNVELVLMNPSTPGDHTVTLKLPARQIRALLDQTTQWVRLPEHPHYLQHPQGQTRYINVANGVQEIIVYGDWTPGDD